MSNPPTVFIPAGVIPAAPNFAPSGPTRTSGSALAAISTQGIGPNIPGGPVVQTTRVNGTLVQTAKS